MGHDIGQRLEHVRNRVDRDQNPYAFHRDAMLRENRREQKRLAEGRPGTLNEMSVAVTTSIASVATGIGTP